MGSELAKAPPVGERVIESIVSKGDLSVLSNAEMGAFYKEVCTSLGLNPLTQPLLPLRLNGKLILYATKNATDQLAARHRMSREITFLDEVVIGGKKYVRATCRATLPDGRVEVANGVVPVGGDGGNDMLKAETKSKRRAALSLLGLGLLDESEVADIPASAREMLAPIDVGPAEPPAVVQAILDDLAQLEYVSLDAAAAIYCDHEREVTADVAEAVRDVLLRACPPKTSVAALKRAIAAARQRRAQGPDAHGADPGHDPTEVEAADTELLRAIQQAPSGKALLGLAPRVDATTGDARGLAVECYCDAWARVINAAPAVETLGAIGKALAGLAGKLGEEVRAGTAEAMARRTAELVPPDSTPPKGRKRAANDAPADEERAAIAAEPSGAAQAEARWRAHLAAKTHAFEVANSLAKHEHDAAYRALGTDAMVRIAIARMVALSAGTEHPVGEMTALNAIKVARAERARKLAMRRAA